jgi:release factor glutamine methyltransferase
MKFFVDERVLIPRPETEDLVDRLLGLRKKRSSPFLNVLDVGVGSGAILLSLMNNGFALKGYGSDISLDALSVARINARRSRLKVEFIESDRLKNVSETFDVIVSNPPYIKSQSHLSGVHQAVHTYEPHLALFLTDQEYDQWFQEFFTQVFMALHPHGIFAMEGHEEEVAGLTKKLTKLGFEDVRVEKDLTERDRFIFATRP